MYSRVNNLVTFLLVFLVILFACCYRFLLLGVCDKHEISSNSLHLGCHDVHDVLQGP